MDMRNYSVHVWEEQQEKGDAAVENRFTLAGLKRSGSMGHGLLILHITCENFRGYIAK
jgi:hypothetical protein